MKKLLNIGNSLFFVMAVVWLYFVIYFLFQYLNVDYTNITPLLSKLLIASLIILFVAFHFRNKGIQIIQVVYKFVVNHKLLVTLCMLFFQLVITITSVGLASADTTILYSMASNSDFAHHNDYISVNPNNFSLLIWMKFNVILFGKNAVFVLALWNILFIDTAIWLCYQINKLFLTPTQSNVSFLMLVGIIGLSPQYIYTYSDPIALFLISLFIYVTSFAVKTSKSLIAVFSGLILAIAYSFRPTILIFIIAGVIVLFLRLSIMKDRNHLFKVIIIAFLAFFCVNRAISFTLSHQDVVKYETNKSRTMLYYVDLGLTYTGNQHAKLASSVRESEGKERNQIAFNDIKNRISRYTFSSFTGHLFDKYYWMVGEGMFGWFQERVLSENQLVKGSSVYSIQQSKLAKFTRTFVYVGGKRYFIYATFIQIIWIIIAIGLVAFTFYYSLSSKFTLWMQITVFGGLLFLLIFEAGRSRYLIQFLPAIITVSSVGLANLVNKKVIFRNNSEGNNLQ